jgi:3-isopropylmalate/(R)-2-methylmalate dehydratase large subunit
MMAEHYALPGQLVVGTDSHTPHSGALGCVAFGVGTTDMANAFVTGAVRLTVPRACASSSTGASLRADRQGRGPAPARPAGDPRRRRRRQGVRVRRPGAARLATDERATLTNMTAELGGFTGIVEPDEETVRFLRERRGVAFEVETWMRSDPGARYADVIRVDCSALTPMVARPGDPGNGVALADLGERVPVDIAYGGSCTAGKREDFDRYHEVLSWAAGRGLRVPAGVALYLQFGTTAVRDYCIARGYLRAFEQVGAQILQPSCGACANCGPARRPRTVR